MLNYIHGWLIDLFDFADLIYKRFWRIYFIDLILLFFLALYYVIYPSISDMSIIFPLIYIYLFLDGMIRFFNANLLSNDKEKISDIMRNGVLYKITDITKYYAEIEYYRKSSIDELDERIPINKDFLPKNIKVGSVIFYNQYCDSIVLNVILNNNKN